MAMNRIIVLSTIGAQAGTGGCLVFGAAGGQAQSFVALPSPPAPDAVLGDSFGAKIGRVLLPPSRQSANGLPAQVLMSAPSLASISRVVAMQV